MSLFSKTLSQWTLPLLLFFGFYSIAHGIQRTETIPLLASYSGLFLVLWIWIRNYSSLWNIFIIGLICRLLFWNHIPALSQDFYRFIWDGNIQLLGINPFRFTPNELIDLIDFPNAQLLFEKMGSLSNENYSNYPPLSQYLYQVMAYFNNDDIRFPVVALRGLYLIGEIFLFFGAKSLLERMELPTSYLSWYFLNPLVIVEGFGNLHGESLMLAFTLFAWLFCLKRKPLLGGLFMALAIGTKLLPLLLIPFFFRYLGIRKFTIFGVSILGFSVLLWIPFWEGKMLENYTQTIQLWFTTFEFNGSLYNIVRAIGYEVKGYNIIRKLGKITPFITLGLVLLFSLFNSNRRPQQIFKSMLFFLSCYFFMATTVHPWYIINLIFLGIISGYIYPILWSLVVFWSYSAYGVEVVEEKIGWQLGAYLLVYGCFFYELFKGRLGHHLQKSNFFSV
jgi:alpha-1,6-mannosyltransferase